MDFFGDDPDESLDEDAVLVVVAIIMCFIPAAIVLWRTTRHMVMLARRVLRNRLRQKQTRPSTRRDSSSRGNLSGSIVTSATRHRDDPRVALEVYLFMQSNWGFYLDLVNSLLSMSSCVLFVVDTYREYDDAAAEIENGVEIFFGCYFALDYLFRLYLAGDRLRYYFSAMALIDLVTLLPFVLFLLLGTRLSGESRGVRVLRMLRIVRMARVLRIFRLERNFSGLSQLVFRIALTLLCLVFCSAGFFWVFETAVDVEGSTPPEELPFHRVIYYCLIETVGRPRIPIGTLTGHFVFYALVISSAVLIPRQVASLLEAMRTDSVYRRSTVPSSSSWFSDAASKRHIIVTGHITFHLMHDFLFQFFHQDHGVAIHNVLLVLLSPDYPSNELRMLLRHPLFEKRVIYVQGSVNMAADLNRARVREASGAFVIAQKLTHGPEQEDLQNIATVLTLKNFQPSLPIYVELLVRRNEHYLYGLPSWNKNTDMALCIVELSNQLIARSALHPGLSTLLSNMFTSQHLESTFREEWVFEYNWGKSHEVYLVELTPAWAGCKWADVQSHLYDRFSVVMLARVYTDEELGAQVLQLAPSGDFDVQQGDRAAVLALHEAHADQVSHEARTALAEGAEPFEQLRSRLGHWALRRSTQEGAREHRHSERRHSVIVERSAAQRRNSFGSNHGGSRTGSFRLPGGKGPGISVGANGAMLQRSGSAVHVRLTTPATVEPAVLPGQSPAPPGRRALRPAPTARRPSMPVSPVGVPWRGGRRPSAALGAGGGMPGGARRPSAAIGAGGGMPGMRRRCGSPPGSEAILGGGCASPRSCPPPRFTAESRLTTDSCENIQRSMHVTPSLGNVMLGSAASASVMPPAGGAGAAGSGGQGGSARQRRPVSEEEEEDAEDASASRVEGTATLGLIGEEAEGSASARGGARSPVVGGVAVRLPAVEGAPAAAGGAAGGATRAAGGARRWSCARQSLPAILGSLVSAETDSEPSSPREGAEEPLETIPIERHVELWSKLQTVAVRYATSGDLMGMLDEQRRTLAAEGIASTSSAASAHRARMQMAGLGYQNVTRDELEHQGEELCGHILLVAERWDGAIESICRTLVHFEPEARTIVVLCKAQPDSLLAERLKRFPDIRWVQGSPLAIDDLRDCAFKTAAAVLILSSGSEEGELRETGSSKTAVMRDSNAVLATLGIRTAVGGLPSPTVITQLNEGSNVRFFDVRMEEPAGAAADGGGGGRKWGDKLRRKESKNKLLSLSEVAGAVRRGGPPAGPQPGKSAVDEAHADAAEAVEEAVRARRALASSKGSVDAAMPQSMVTTSNSVAAAQQAASSALLQQDTLMSGTLEHSADFAAGSVFSAPLLDKLLSESFYHPYSIELVKQLIEGDIANERMLYRIPVPERAVGGPWRALFHQLCAEDYAPLGLYRTALSSSGKPTSYVYTNPLYDTPIVESDFVFVIGSPKQRDGLGPPAAADGSGSASKPPRKPSIRKTASDGRSDGAGSTGSGSLSRARCLSAQTE